MPARTTTVRLAAALLVLSGLGSVLATDALAAGRPAVASHAIARCHNGQLVNWLNTSGNGYAGGVGYEVTFTNVSTVECSLYGFPGVSAVNLAGRQIGRPATRDGVPGAVVEVKPGASAKADLLVEDTSAYPTSSCKPVTADGLRVYAAGLTASDVIPYPFSVCSGHTVSISIQPTH